MERKSFIQTLIEREKKESEAKSQEGKKAGKKEIKRVSPIKGKIRVRKRYEKKPKWYNYEEVKDKVVKRNGRWYWKEEIEQKKEEPKPEVKTEEKTPEKEAESIKEKVENISDSETLEKTEQLKEEPKEEKQEEKPKEGFDISKFLKGFYEKNDIWIWLIGLGFLIWAGMKFLSGRSSPKVPAKEETEQPSKPGTRKVDIGSPGHPHIVDWPIQ
jgi:hypothetical protein